MARARGEEWGCAAARNGAVPAANEDGRGGPAARRSEPGGAEAGSERVGREHASVAVLVVLSLATFFCSNWRRRAVHGSSSQRSIVEDVELGRGGCTTAAAGLEEEVLATRSGRVSWPLDHARADLGAESVGE
jgi:hypothetical protein